MNHNLLAHALFCPPASSHLSLGPMMLTATVGLFPTSPRLSSELMSRQVQLPAPTFEPTCHSSRKPAISGIAEPRVPVRNSRLGNPCRLSELTSASLSYTQASLAIPQRHLTSFSHLVSPSLSVSPCFQFLSALFLSVISRLPSIQFSCTYLLRYLLSPTFRSYLLPRATQFQSEVPLVEVPALRRASQWCQDRGPRSTGTRSLLLDYIGLIDGHLSGFRHRTQQCETTVPTHETDV